MTKDKTTRVEIENATFTRSKIFEPTPVLRWLRRKEDEGDGIYLQQQYVEYYTHEIEWRDVPTVEEENQ